MHPVCDLVGLDPDQARRHGVDAGEKPLEVDVPELLGVRLLQSGIEELPERTAAAHKVLPEPALRLVDPERAGPAGRQPLEMLRLLMAVQAVPVLVHRREERLERVGVVVGRDPDVVAAGAGGKWMLGWIDPPAVGPVAEQVRDLIRERALALGREVSLEERRVHVPLAQLGNQLDERRLQLTEQLPHLRGRRLRLVVVEQDVVPLGCAVRDAVDVLELELDGPFERRQEGGEVRLRLRLDPDRPRLGSGAGHVRPQRRRHLDRLLVVPADERDQRGVVGIGIQGVLDGVQLLQEPAHLGIGETLVRNAKEGRELVGTVSSAGGRHHRLLVPGEKARDLAEIRDLRQALLEPLERVRHPRQSSGLPFPHAPVAQWTERRTSNPRVGGSNPPGRIPPVEPVSGASPAAEPIQPHPSLPSSAPAAGCGNRSEA